MINGKRILVIVPARGGSKGIPLKNMKSVGGISLITRVGNVVREIVFIDKAIVSTDHEGIAKLAIQSGLECPFYRPPSLSGDLISDLDVLTHALNEMEKIDKTIYDIILMLQPTSPLRTATHVADTVQMLIETNADSVWTLSKTDPKGHPNKQLVVKDAKIEYYTPEGANIIARQQLTPTYHKNGVAYAITRDCILNQKSIKGKKCIPVIIEGYIPNIDSEIDIKFAEFLLSTGEMQ